MYNLENLTSEDLAVKATENGSFDKIYTILFNRHQDSLNKYLAKFYPFSKEDREDVIQTTFEKVLKKLNTYKPTFKFSTWLHSIAINSSIDKIRKNKKNIVDNSNEIHYAEKFKQKTFISPEEKLNRKQVYKIIENCMNKLTKSEKEIFEIQFRNDFKYKELSEILGLDQSKIKSRLFKARRRMGKVINEDYGQDFITSNFYK